MSLVAAVAVAGLSSTAAAQPLEEAIKGVDVSGTMVYRYDDRSDDVAGAGDAVSNNYKIGVSLKSKVNDMVTANVRIVTGTDALNGNSSFASLNTSTSQDLNPDLRVTNANFAATLGSTTVIAGKQGLGTPWTIAVDSDGNEQTGTGILALSNLGAATVAAGYFNQTDLGDSGDDTGTLAALDAGTASTVGAKDIYTIAAMGNVAGVALDAWYLDMDEMFDTYTVGAKAKFDMVSVEARYASLDADALTTDNAMFYIKLGAKVGGIGLKATYGSTDKDGGLTALDDDAKTTLNGWNMNMNAKADADMIMLGADMDIMSGLNLAVNYNDQEYAGNNEENELYATLTYKMSKNLKSYVRYGTYDKETAGVDANERTRGRLQIEYKF